MAQLTRPISSRPNMLSKNSTESRVMLESTVLTIKLIRCCFSLSARPTLYNQLRNGPCTAYIMWLWNKYPGHCDLVMRKCTGKNIIILTQISKLRPSPSSTANSLQSSVERQAFSLHCVTPD